MNIIRNDAAPNSVASLILDGLRFFAALTVLVYHIVYYFDFASPDDAQQYLLHGPWYQTLLNTWCSTGFQAVIVFFVLSGYLVGSSVLKSVDARRWSWRIYLVHRMTRLWIVLIPALILTALWGYVQIKLFGAEWYFRGTLDINTFVGNLFFLQNVKFSEFGGNGPLWSLTNEFWYYILFPCIVLAIRYRSASRRILYCGAILTICLLVGPKVIEYFAIWLFGALLAITPPLRLSGNAIRLTLICGSTFIALVSLKVPYMLLNVPDPTFKSEGLQYIADAIVGLAFALFVYSVVSILNARPRPSVKRCLGILKWLAGFSYTLYLTHYPLLHFLSAWQVHQSGLLGRGPWPYLHNPLRNVVFDTVSALVFAIAISRFTETKTAVVRERLLRRLPSKPINRTLERYL